MNRRLLVLSLVALAACSTSPLGRHRIMLFSQGELANMGRAAFTQMREKTPVTRDAATERYVGCVARAITAVLPDSAPRTWEVAVFREDSANAFALPGGYIGVHTGLLEVAENQDQLATVVGHEVAHVLAEHPNERISTTAVAQNTLAIAQAWAGGATSGANREIFALLGMGTQVGVLLPFSRAQESEADLLGLDLMAMAGFDPRESLQLWRNMAKAGGAKPPEFLSTHPSGTTRLRDLDNRMSRAMGLYEEARAAGRRPRCRR
jgi:predicted Zn-dependent protease